MPKTIQLQVPGPCHKNWDQMTGTDRGRYCLSCRKEVIDFTLMTDQQILKFISKAAGGVCGRFRNEQLNRDMELKKDNHLSWYKYLIHMMIPAILATHKSSAEGTISGARIVFSVPKDSSHRLTRKIAIKEEMPKHETITIEGKLSDEKLPAIPGAGVTLEGTLGGIFVVGQTISKKKENIPIIQSLKDSITNFFREDAVRIYPNPTQKGSTFNIDFDVKNTGEYELTIINISGQPVMQKKIFLASKKHTEQIECDDRMRPGIYFVQVVNFVSKRICMNKLLVQ